MDPKELKELLAGLKTSMDGVGTALNTLVEGQKAHTELLQGLKGKKPKADDDEEEDEDMKALSAKVDALEKSLAKQEQHIEKLYETVEAQTKSIELIAEKVAPSAT